MKLRQKKTMTAYLFLIVPLIFFIFVRFFPTIYAFWLSFTDWNIISPKMNFVGFDNFRALFADSVFMKALWNTFKYVLYGVPLVLVLSFAISLLLNNIRKGQAFYRLIYVMPYITPLVAVSWVWRWMYQRPPVGVINNLFSFVGIPTQRFLFSMDQALIAIVVTTVWVNLGYCIVIFLAGLQTIPKEYLEASKIDGANRWQVLTKITVPLLNPVILFLVVTQSILFLRIFTQVYNMTDQGSGGPLNSTKPLVLYIYQKAFLSFEMGSASSATVVLFGIILLITLLQFRLLKRRVQY
ncbi:MAG TPA: sugar ABC transporter permease [Thermotogota bacterium]|jgi:multiple sugar transport system permease protein|nr:sugar ABC transporter permease [Thermotogota bacterium]HNT96154.1 sugar ABC transporter permease [Thermotogota bacterium]HOZ12017.1 sugar ABC transporter permease [Thermotogota bacterium]HPB87244.1 sugar ABC transporter permease [Thermotogota bacterium]HPH10516.1 sugar ABC transporter permease [Thermotogota bacterium]